MSRAAGPSGPAQPVALRLPFRGTWIVRNSPARRVPSHGTHAFGASHAIDFVAVRAGRTAAVRDWRTVLAVEPVDRFHAFEQPILAPAGGRVVSAQDGEPDLVARRSPLAGIGYALSQASRARRGARGLAGNHVVLDLADGGPYLVVAHLRQGTVAVRPGETVVVGQALGRCGNSGNSTQPHVHLQVMDDADPFTATGVPIVFRDYHVRRRDGAEELVRRGVPDNGDVVEAVEPGTPAAGHAGSGPPGIG
ncbi:MULTISPECIES: M23 family metallopeptidase [Micromonospora]|uniref:M23 family metallopeptidase n=1 Tax=Micromonospora solifontis TaxID=2487138 RepID=A0ABX9WFQ0_9ACTN|nr:MULTISPECIES: M23 family metallopeptidase [Micromonospora]NES13949.1 M23 family metallopeptidase [Micromonospora sp. PPF5-17B]NES37492.1 M23 family metallopeptidase [Micromonospora solifontis]NES54049.1 M23 family metallopeptidase [Micromonospora sp. PPF5-6]RNL98299.1 M23 family metallopeptidase [Micromonospora solifontis]